MFADIDLERLAVKYLGMRSEVNGQIINKKFEDNISSRFLETVDESPFLGKFSTRFACLVAFQPEV